MKRLSIRFKVILMTTVMTASGLAQGILQDQATGAGVFNTPDSRKGQSFTAVDSFTSIGVGLQVFNKPNNPTVLMSLYQGTGLTSDTLLGTRTVTPAGGALGDIFWVDFDFSNTALQPGAPYTFVLGAPSPYWGVQFNDLNPGAVDYPGGQMLDYNGFDPNKDLRFRVMPVPEPRACVLGAFALLILVVSHFAKQRVSERVRPQH